jgi:hypothetical protein
MVYLTCVSVWLLGTISRRTVITESCPGRPHLWPAGVKHIARHQAACDGPVSARFLVPRDERQDGPNYFGGAVAYTGTGAQLGPATWLLGQAISAGRIFARREGTTPSSADAVFSPLTPCTISADELAAAPNATADLS